MNDIEETTTVVAASDIEVDHATLDASIKEFAGDNGEYYADKFQRIHSSTGMLPNTFNPPQFSVPSGPPRAASGACSGDS